DHETVTANGGSFHDPTHGWYFNADGSIDIQVAGNAIVNVTLCTYSESGDVILKNGETEIGRTTVVKNGSEGATPDGTEYSYKYTGEATTLTLSWTAKQYIHKIVVYNVLDFLEKDEATGYFIVPAGDAACFLLALVQAESGDKIFLPNGTYDLGETVLTPITKNNISIIGQSMEGVIIKNKALTPGIGATATLLIEKNVTNTYLQDLTLQNTFDYYKNNDGVAVVLQDKGTKTICKNVCLLSYQDTYYSNLQGALKYFETSKIHGTVDFICGDGSVYFKNTELICEQRSTNGGGQDALTASNSADSDKGYVFESCSVRYADNIAGTKPVVSLGRSWNNKPKTIFLNTLLADDLVMTKDANAQKDKIQRWTCGGMNILPEKFGEYNSVNAAGQVVSPASNNVTFVLNNDEKQMETILTAEEAATYTMEYTLGAWAETAKADATQAVVETEGYEETGIYLVELLDDGSCSIVTGKELNAEVMLPGVTIRKANARGGFGKVAGDPGQGVENTAAEGVKVQKIIRDGQVIIVRDNREYTVFGMQL
ncbi:MAG: pectate lyase, partial [Paludibacteraceae bacterium]|nr:pectate lyase [Paludibacteraceae bacterium]